MFSLFEKGRESNNRTDEKRSLAADYREKLKMTDLQDTRFESNFTTSRRRRRIRRTLS